MVGSRSIIVKFEDVFLRIRVFGNGNKNLVAFHGYGQNGEIFRESDRKREFTVYAFDLFYHGGSCAPIPDQGLSHELFRKMFSQFLEETGIKEFTLLGFSMGGKYALSLLIPFANYIQDIHLIAPDGIRVNFWYWLATGSCLTRRLFKYVVNHPKPVFYLIHFLNHIGLLNKMVAKFAINQMDTFDKRNKVYNSWVYLRKLFVDMKQAAGVLYSYNISITVVTGRYDRVIRYGDVARLVRLVPQAKYVQVNAGHSNLLPKYLAEGHLL